MSNGKSSACPPFFRLLPNRVWRTYLGGRILDGISGKSAPEDTHFPEDWLLSTTIARNPGREHLTTEGVSQVELDGEVMPLTAVIKKFPGEMLGAEHLRPERHPDLRQQSDRAFCNHGKKRNTRGGDQAVTLSDNQDRHICHSLLPGPHRS